MSEEMIEKVARVLCERATRRKGHWQPGEEKLIAISVGQNWRHYVPDAEAAVSAYNPNERLREALEAIKAIVEVPDSQAVVTLVVAFDEIHAIAESALSPLPQGEDT